MILSNAFILPVSQFQTQQVMTSLICSLMGYLIQTCAHFRIKVDEKSSLNGRFQYDLMMIRDSDLLFWATLYVVYTVTAFWRNKG